MSIDRATGLFGWNTRDVTRLMERVRRVKQPTIAMPCEECQATGHAHRRAYVGPYVICRCLQCPVLVIEGAG